MLRSIIFITLLVATLSHAQSISPPSPELQKKLSLSPFYKKSLSASGLYIVSSEKPSDHALREAAFLIDNVLRGRDDLRQALIDANVRVVVMAYNEFTTDIPEHSQLRPPRDSKLTGKQYWDKRARGLGGTRRDPVTSCGEENLLNFKGDPYQGENILIHEFAHIIQTIAIRNVNPDIHKQISDAYKAAKEEGLWKGTYAMTNDGEYFAEAVQSFFDCNAQNNAVHNDIDTRDELKAYDPRMHAILERVFANNNWRYVPTTRRADLAHLKEFDRETAPTFAWPPELLRANRPTAEKPGEKPGEKTFIHPGILNTKESLAFVKAKVAAGEQPWKEAFDNMKAMPQASLDYQPKPHEIVNCGSGSRPDFGCTDEKRDSQIAYLHALLWVMTDDVRHARKSAQILKAWCILKEHGMSNANLQAGWTGGPFLRAAEILRHTWPDWPKQDQDEFTAMIRRAFLPRVAEPQKSSFNGNWEAVMIETAMSIAVFTDDRALFDSAITRYRRLLPAYIYGTEDGPVPITIDPAHFDTREKIDKHWHGQTILFDGLSQETGRDLTHTQWGLGGLINCAEIAWNQGIDLYSERSNRLLRGMEFHAKFLNGAPVPQDLQNGRLRGAQKFCPAWEIGFNHYHFRKSLPMPETEKLLAKNRPEIGPDHHLSFGTLTHHATGGSSQK